MKRVLVLHFLVLLVATGCARSPEITPTTIVEDRSLPNAAAYVPDTGRPDLLEGTPVLDREWSTDSRKFSFAIIGDKTGGGRDNWPIFDSAIAEINLLRPDFAIMVGDLIQGYTPDTVQASAEWEEFHSHADAIDASLLFLPGNHDVTTPQLMDFWQRNIGRLYYSFDYLGCHFIVLNTEQERFTGKWDFGTEQMEFILSDLAEADDARHTFLFMHKPAWDDETYAADWTRIDDVLLGRPHTVFAGHRHNLSHEVRSDARHIVLGPTGAGLNPSNVKELGAFHHYTWVTVDGDSAHVAFIEPEGDMWSEDVATADFMRKARSIVSLKAHMPIFRDDGIAEPSLEIVMRNALPDTTEVYVRFSETRGRPNPTGWRQTVGLDRVREVLAPGDTRTYTAQFEVSEGRMPVSPYLHVETWYHGTPMNDYNIRVPIFPDTAFHRIPVWRAIGPLLNREVQGNMVDFTPDMMRPFSDLLGPDGMVRPGAHIGMSVADTGSTESLIQRTLESDERDALRHDGLSEPVTRVESPDTDTISTRSIGWSILESDERGFLDFGRAFETTDRATAFALAEVISPNARRVWARVKADDYVRLMLNGDMVGEGYAYSGGRGDMDYVPLDFKAGKNVLVMKAVNTGSGWNASMRLVDPNRELTFNVTDE
jgi:hypothetical protein